MIRMLSLIAMFVVLTGAGIAIALWPRASAAAQGFSSESQLMAAYARVHEGTPVSKLAELGFDPVRAQRLSALGLMEHFMPKDSVSFDSLDPAVQDCFGGRGDCSAYIVPVAQSRAEAVLLVEGGKVAWKKMRGVSLSQARRNAKLARG